MRFFVDQVISDAEYLLECSRSRKLAYSEALQIAVQIQQNRFFSEAFMVSQGARGYPTALEAIASQLGMAVEGTTIKHALFDIADAVRQSKQN